MNCWDVFGVCIEKRLDLGNAILVGVGLLGLFSIWLGYRQLRAGQRAQQVQTLIQLHDDFFGTSELRAFLYRLDYKGGARAWQFNSETFAHSAEERDLDLILYKLAFIGTLVQNGDIPSRDLLWLKAETAIVLENPQVLAYLRWLQSPGQIPGHASFSGAVHLYIALFGSSGSAFTSLKLYLDQARTTR
jgi:hypothetical protein